MVENDVHRMFTLLANCNERADRLLADLLGVSRTRIQRNISRQNILRNGQVLTKNSFTGFHAGDLIEAEIEPLEELSLAPEPIPLEIVHANEDFIVVNKPPNLVVHPAPGHPSGTLMNGIAYYLGKEEGNNIRPGLVHRIDKDTSGLLVVARSSRAFEELSARFAAHDVERSYLALAWGRFRDRTGTIRTGHARDPQDRRRFYPAEGGRLAITHYEVLEQYGTAALVKLMLETGRTHQIRMHLRYLGHPVVNDETYGGVRKSGKPALDRVLAMYRRHMLHAGRLGFTCCGRQWTFESPIPNDMSTVIAACMAAS